MWLIFPLKKNFSTRKEIGKLYNILMIAKITNFLRKYRYHLLFFIAVLGPGIITSVADNDAGGVATYLGPPPSTAWPLNF